MKSSCRICPIVAASLRLTASWYFVSSAATVARSSSGDARVTPDTVSKVAAVKTAPRFDECICSSAYFPDTRESYGGPIPATWKILRCREKKAGETQHCNMIGRTTAQACCAAELPTFEV